ncbi:MAG TPA: tRNA 2-thiouridine(34) synthase MnmA [Steroidobacteraceae bacterium]|jgi:tRNA-specific 2-thiouridylase|nr:tRNA 2-thiouridine(34) synthase MnmA [Steroidobacteraceae bacterium]
MSLGTSSSEVSAAPVASAARPAVGERVIVGLSGGVDSAVAALLLREAGYEVHGLFMANWEEDDAYCTTAQDYQDARDIAAELGIVLHRVSFAAQYRERVFQHFLDEYRAGRTPNPDVLCNREIKFGLCLGYARRLGARWFATGHYARRLDAADGPALHQAADAAKDQSYFLHAVERARLAQVLFPLGELHKGEVRERARRAGLRVHAKPDSTGICFIGERPFAEFLGRYLPTTPGPIETADGRHLGRHRGLPFYTLGQRAGLEVGGLRDCAPEPWYVADKIPARNALIVVQRHEQWRLEAHGVRVGRLNWLCAERYGGFSAQVKLRYRQPSQSARVCITADGGATLEFETAQRAATPGQYAVLYEDGRCLGGGVIEAVTEAAAVAAAEAGDETAASRRRIG